MLRNLIVDGSNIVKANLSVNTEDFLANGDYVGGVTGTLRQISKFVDRLEPDAVFVAFDFDKSEYRLNLHPEYKAGRVITDPDRKWRFDHTHAHQRVLMDLFAMMGIHSIEVPKVEADDIIANFVHQSKRSNVIVSTDKDFLQLIDPTTSVYRPGPSLDVYITDHEVDNYCRNKVFKLKEEAEYHREWFLPIRALQSDVSDNIMGAKGVGPARAVEVLTTYGLNKNAIIEGEEVKKRKWSQSLVKFLKEDGWAFNVKLMDLADSLKVDVAKYIKHPTFEPDKVISYLTDLEYDDILFEEEMHYLINSFEELKYGRK